MMIKGIVISFFVFLLLSDYVHAPENTATTTCQAKIEVFDYNLIANKVALIKAISNKQGRITIFARGLSSTDIVRLKECGSTSPSDINNPPVTECVYRSGQENPSYSSGTNLPISYSGLLINYYAEITTASGEYKISDIKLARIGDQGYQNTFCADETHIVSFGGVETPGTLCNTPPSSSTCQIGYCGRVLSTAQCIYPPNCISNNALQTLISCPVGSAANQAGSSQISAGTQGETSNLQRTVNRLSASQSTGATRSNFYLSTRLNKASSEGSPAEYSSNEEISLDYELRNLGEAFNTNVCFFLEDSNHNIHDITSLIENKANEQYCNINSPNCPIRLNNIIIGNTNPQPDAKVTGNIFKYTFPASFPEGVYRIIAQLRDANAGCTPSNIDSISQFGRSFNYFRYRSNVQPTIPSVTTSIIEWIRTNPDTGPYGTIFILNVKFSNRLEGSNPVAMIQKDSRDIATVNLFDDGAHGDEGPNDNIYGNRWDSSGQPLGHYSILILIANSRRNEILEEFSILGNNCVEVFKGGDMNEKIDITFVSRGFTDSTDFRNQVEMHAGLRLGIDGSNDGIFNVEPFKSNKHKFNVYLVNQLLDDRSAAGNLFLQCPTDFSMILNRANFRSTVGHVSIVNDRGTSDYIRTTVHEFGHAIGELLDEYIEDGRSSPLVSINGRNCFSTAPIMPDRFDCAFRTCFSNDGCLANCNPPDNDCLRISCLSGDGCAVGCTPVDPDCGNGASCSKFDGCLANCNPSDPDCIQYGRSRCGNDGLCVFGCTPSDNDCEILCRAGNVCQVGCTPVDTDCGNGASCNEGDGCAGGSCFRAFGGEHCISNARWKELIGNGCNEEGVIDCEWGRDPNYNFEINCIEGCNYASENIFRPAYNTIMRYHHANPYSFGQANEKALCQSIKSRTGSAGGICTKYRLE